MRSSSPHLSLVRSADEAVVHCVPPGRRATFRAGLELGRELSRDERRSRVSWDRRRGPLLTRPWLTGLTLAGWTALAFLAGVLS